MKTNRTLAVLFFLATLGAAPVAAGPIEDALDGGVGTYVTPDGSDAAWSVFGSTVRSGVVSTGQTSRISVTVDGPGIISFYWNIDAFHTSLPQTELFASSGMDLNAIGSLQIGFIPESLRVASGPNQKISWTYRQLADPLQGTGTAGLNQVYYFPQRKRLASDSAPGRNFASAIAMAGNLALIGARIGFGNEGQSGTANLFDVTDPLNPVELAKLQAPSGEFEDYFGWSVALCGNIALVGTPGAVHMGGRTGAVYAFDLTDPLNPELIRMLTPGDGEDSDAFGGSVAIDGHLALVGSPEAADRQGKVYLFDFTDPNNPVELAVLTAADAADVEFFGYTVAIEGNTALVGTPLGADNGEASGSAYLFDLTDPFNPVETAKILASDGATNDFFGSTVDLSGNRALIGAYGKNSTRGAAYLYDVSDLANPVEKSKILDSDGAADDSFGYSVSLGGDFALMGTPGDDPEGLTAINAGSAHLFDISDPANPFERAEFTAHDLAGGDQYGWSIALAGNRAVMGTEFDDNFTGSAYFYDLRSLGAADSFRIAPEMRTVGHRGGNYALLVNVIGTWNASSDSPDFATIDKSTGTGNAGLNVNVAPNLSPSARTAKITVNGVEHTLIQDGFNPPAPVISAPGSVNAKKKGMITASVQSLLPVTMTAKATGGATVQVRGGNPFKIIVKKLNKKVTRVRLTTTDSVGRSSVKIVKLKKK